MGRTALHNVADHSLLAKSWKRIDSKAKGPKREVSGVDGITVRDFSLNSDRHIKAIRRDLSTGRYVFSDLLAFTIPKGSGGHRIINIPTVHDRIVQSSLLRFLSGKVIFKSQSNYGFLQGKTVGAAVQQFVKLRCSFPYVVKVDIQAFFDTIPRDELLKRVEKKVRYKSVLQLIFEIINCESNFRSHMDHKNASQQGLKAGVGIRQGMPLSPFLANLYLDQFDVFIEKAGYKLVRYADDFVILCASEELAEKAKADAVSYLTDIGLSVSPSKTKIYHPTESVDFLGMDCVEMATKSYSLEVSAKKVRNLVSNLAAFRDIQFCLKNNVKLFGLERRIDLMISGYYQAYQLCSNIQSVMDKLYAEKKKTIGTLITKVFGVNINSLDANQRNFLGLA
jgi:group II intron reverse transcriptase/maturase